MCTTHCCKHTWIGTWNYYNLWGLRCPNQSPVLVCPPLAAGAGQLKVTTFNGQGIICHDRAASHRNFAFLSSLALSSDIICLQELYGLQAEIECILSGLLPNWLCLVSAATNFEGLPCPGAGGVAICISPKVVHRANSINSQVLADGRCIEGTIAIGQMTFNIINIHNAGLSNAQVHYIRGYLEDRRLWDQDHPTLATTLLIGDVNFMGAGERRFHAGRPIGVAPPAGSFGGAAHSHAWMRELKSWVEISQPFPTHFCSSTKSSSRIDRAWTTTTSAAILQIQITSSVRGTPGDVYAKAISDHAALDVIFSCKQVCSSFEKPIPKAVTHHHLYASIISDVAQSVDLFNIFSTT